jgi:hypothetical protein|tara:strand:+ start:778 stop:978 length:201 start_codon:yes stop_codon:yes gene_type:complete
MSDQNFEILETEIKELIKLSTQLKEANDHLSKKNTGLLEKNKKLNGTLDTTKTKVQKVINKLKSQK